MTDQNRKSVLVTGASTGIGRATARHLAQQGLQVFAGVRKEVDAESIRRENMDCLSPVFLEITSQASINDALETIGGSLDALHGLVNNAGIALGGPQEFLEIDVWRRQFEINVVGTVAVTKTFLPLLRAAGSGRVVNIGSMAGTIPVPFLGPYCASKHALEALTSSLRMELSPSRILVTLIRCGNVRTPIWEKGQDYTNGFLDSLPEEGARLYRDRLERISSVGISEGHRGVPPERVAQAVWQGLTSRRPREYYLVGPDAQLRQLARWLMPTGMLEYWLRKRFGV